MRHKKNSSFTFNAIPKVNIPRNKFDMSYSHKTSFNQGDIVPFMLQEVYPGDTFKDTSTFVIRTSSSLYRPIMDNLFLDTYYFYVPSRLVYDKFPQVFGENTNGPWANTQEFNIPCMTINGASGSNLVGTVADYLGLPVNQIFGNTNSELLINVLPFRAFAKVYDEWFRDENVIAPMNIQTGFNGTNGAYSNESLSSSPWSVNNYTGQLPKVAKLHDYFTSSLPSPQKGDPVSFNLVSGYAPVAPFTGANNATILTKLGNVDQLKWGQNNNGTITDGFSSSGALATANGSRTFVGGSQSSTQVNNVIPTNLSAYVGDLGAVTVNDLRFAFQLQKMLEKDARGGTRYTEYIQSHFNVLNPDARLQRSEYLGGKRSPINIQQVTQTTGYDDDTLGQVGAFSLSSAKSGFIKSFTEHGYILGVCCVRQFHTYQQGLARFWTRRKRIDFYDPVFANIGEQPIYSNEIFMARDNASNSNIFGYNEAWCDLRYNNSRISGQMRSQGFNTLFTNSLDIWHLGDNYTNAPTLSQAFIEEPNYIDRVLAVNSANQHNFIVDIFNKMTAVRPLPLYSVPGLIDHH